MHMKLSFAKRRAFCPGGDELNVWAGEASHSILIGTWRVSPVASHANCDLYMQRMNRGQPEIMPNIAPVKSPFEWRWIDE